MIRPREKEERFGAMTKIVNDQLRVAIAVRTNAMEHSAVYRILRIFTKRDWQHRESPISVGGIFQARPSLRRRRLKGSQAKKNRFYIWFRTHSCEKHCTTLLSNLEHYPELGFCSLRHFGHLSHNNVKTRRNSIH